MASFDPSLVANVTEAGDIELFAIVLAVTLVVGLAILGIDALVGRLRRSHRPEAGPRPAPVNCVRPDVKGDRPRRETVSATVV